MTMRPDPTFHASPRLAMEAPAENFAYTVMLSPDFSKPDALGVVDVNPSSPTYSQMVHTVMMPNKGDDFHHFGEKQYTILTATGGVSGCVYRKPYGDVLLRKPSY
jgi:56kDa selenium binding protein (SBP56)